MSCRRLGPKQEFWRLVRLSGSTTVCLDQGQGRSAYLCPQADCLRLAQRKHRLGRALKAPVPEAIWATLWQRLGEGRPDAPEQPVAEQTEG